MSKGILTLFFQFVESKKLVILRLIGLDIQVAMKGYRLNLSEKVPKSYRNLIEKCWSQSPTKRHSFYESVHSLKTDLDS